MDVCMYVRITFPDLKQVFGASKLVMFELQLCRVNNKTCRVSWNIVIFTLRDSCTHATHIFWGKVCSNVLKQY